MINLDDGDLLHECIYDIYDDLPDISYQSSVTDKKGVLYNNSIILTFDIETTLINGDNPYTYMYQWQMGINEYVFMGRTWAEWIILLRRIIATYNKHGRLVCYVHNLSYEYQFFKDFILPSDVFATREHKVIKCLWEIIEFRCSYLLSNMSLDRWTSIVNTPYHKLTGKYDYDMIRTPTTPLTATELAYCYCDVRGLYDCIVKKIADDNDNIGTVPLTSTGYVRRDARYHVKQNPHNWDVFSRSEISPEVYRMCKLAFRGGNTGANRYIIDTIVNDLQCYDIASSYPYQMYIHTYPTGQWVKQPLGIKTNDILDSVDDYGYLISLIMHNVSLKFGIPIPYLSFSKCRINGKYLNCNGRILEADELITICTEIDLSIILSQYDCDKIQISLTYQCEKMPLPSEYIDCMLKWFERKCELKCDENEDNYYYYIKSKNSLNSFFGVSVTDIVHSAYLDNTLDIIQHGDIDERGNRKKAWITEPDNVAKSLTKYYTNRNNFLSYPWGVWITAYARQQLQELIDIVGMDTCYVDTDSNKHTGDYSAQVEAINQRILADTYVYKNSRGKECALGVWETDPPVKHFKTLGAKKYMCDYGDHVTITVSGLSKHKSTDYIKSLDDFEVGTVVPAEYSGRMTAHFNERGIHYIYVNGERILSASNVALVPTTYTLGISEELSQILTTLERW